MKTLAIWCACFFGAALVMIAIVRIAAYLFLLRLT